MLLGAIVRLHVAKPDPPKPPHEAAVFEVVRIAESDGRNRMANIVSAAQVRFGAYFSRLKKDFVLPALEHRGLVVGRRERLLGIFPRTVYARTPGGEVVRQDVERRLEQARKLPALLDSDPKEAAAVALAAGSLILLIPELRTHYQQIGQAIRDSGASIGGAGGDSGGAGPSPLTDPGREFPDFGALIDSAFNSIDSGIAAFDAGGDGGGGD